MCFPPSSLRATASTIWAVFEHCHGGAYPLPRRAPAIAPIPDEFSTSARGVDAVSEFGRRPAATGGGNG